MTSYEPIDCGVHDRLEAFAVTRTQCRIEYATPAGEERVANGLIVNVFARDGAEYIQLDDRTEIRLDRLRSVERDSS
ncbi:MAG: hypothetical protein WD995_08970 [Gemmatimonadota bacterium]